MARVRTKEENRLRTRAYVAKDREAWNARVRAWTAKNKERVAAQRKARRAKNYDKIIAQERINSRKRDWHADTMLKYGITKVEYNAMLSVVPGCAICGRLPGATNGGRRLAVDHDHDTGRVRGLLCESCNNGLGRFKDNPQLLTAAAEYLKGTGK